MNQEIQKKWIEDLRSGKFVQGKHYLQRNKKFCCLGVLCDLAERHGVIPEPELNEEDGGCLYGEDREKGSLPQEVMQWADIKEARVATPVQHNGVDYTYLVDLNDTVGLTFNQIADLIEKGVS